MFMASKRVIMIAFRKRGRDECHLSTRHIDGSLFLHCVYPPSAITVSLSLCVTSRDPNMVRPAKVSDGRASGWAWTDWYHSTPPVKINLNQQNNKKYKKTIWYTVLNIGYNSGSILSTPSPPMSTNGESGYGTKRKFLGLGDYSRNYRYASSCCQQWPRLAFGVGSPVNTRRLSRDDCNPRNAIHTDPEP